MSLHVHVHEHARSVSLIMCKNEALEKKSTLKVALQKSENRQVTGLTIHLTHRLLY